MEAVVVKGSKCEDCGNQAKKDCAYSRCRTCCKNKAFNCQTHIRSTWIPVDTRRHKLQDQPRLTTNLQLHEDIPKSHNKHHQYSSLDQELKFPAVMSSMALFNCVQVRSMDDTVNEIAYQTSVNIGGHVFTGLLYDQGPHQQTFINTRDGASATMPPQLSVTAAQEPFFPFPLASSFRP